MFVQARRHGRQSAETSRGMKPSCRASCLPVPSVILGNLFSGCQLHMLTLTPVLDCIFLDLARFPLSPGVGGCSYLVDLLKWPHPGTSSAKSELDMGCSCSPGICTPTKLLEMIINTHLQPSWAWLVAVPLPAVFHPGLGAAD